MYCVLIHLSRTWGDQAVVPGTRHHRRTSRNRGGHPRPAESPCRDGRYRFIVD